MNINPSSNPLVRYVQAPQSDNQNSAMHGVCLFPDEEVQWNYTYINGQASVTGYTVTKKINIGVDLDEIRNKNK
jgi:hypothetical protein